MIKAAWIVFCKELLDALRDRRTLGMVVLSSTVIGPLLLLALSSLVMGMEKRAEAREVIVQGIEHAPSLRNYLLRQSYTLISAPADYAARLKSNDLAYPVLVIGDDFEAKLQQGEAPVIELMNSSANQRSDNAMGRLGQVLQGFADERTTLRLALRGLPPSISQPFEVQERDLANPQARAVRLTGMLPFFVLMAVLYGALNAALDTTAGERERGSLEPLLMSPAPRWALVLGKWGAAASVGMLIAVLSCLSFLPGQWLLQSETLAAMFQFGPREAALFIALLLPLAAALTALMMAVAIHCRTFKEAQANNALVMLSASLLPLISQLSQEGEKPWHLWLPALAQTVLMNRVLKGETLSTWDVAIPFGVSSLIAVGAIALVARQLRVAVAR